MHTCPALRNLYGASISAARSTSASSKMITGAWPPSSNVQRFISDPANEAISLPTATDPVNETLRTIGDVIRYFDTSEGTPQTTFRQPGGRPESWNSRASATTALGASSGPFSTMVHPDPTAAAILRIAWLNGKFQGEKPAQTPIGSRSTSWRTPSVRDGITRP